MDIPNSLRRFLRHREPGAPLARDFYTDDKIFALDL